MGLKSSKNHGNEVELEALKNNRDLEAGIRDEDGSSLTDDSRESERDESRCSSGSDSYVSSLNNVDILFPLPSELQETGFSSESQYSITDSDLMDYFDYEKEQFNELITPEQFAQLKKMMLTPKELFEREYGPLPDENTVEVIETEEMKTPPLEIAAMEPPKSSESDLLTDLSDDEEGWPKYDMNAIMEEAERKGEVIQNPLIPKIEDYVRDKNTCGQKVLNCYDFAKVFSHFDKTIHLEAHGPDASRIQDFWTQCHKDQVGVISMFGDFMRGANCARYIPEDNREELRSGKIVVRRVTDPEYPLEHCKVQKFAVRCVLVPEEHGWYSVWHIQRSFQDDQFTDYSNQNAEFEKLRLKLLENMKSKQWLQHGPMQSSPIRKRVPGVLDQKMDFRRMCHPYYLRKEEPISISTDFSESCSSMESD